MVFSDEKKFNLVRPNRSQCYWHDLRKENQLFLKILFEGGSVMVQGAFSVSGKADLVVIEGNNNNINNAIFQQDNANIHTSKLTKD